jgi:VanZ family protein
LAWGLVILILTSWPSPPSVIDLTYTDEFAHLGVYAVLGWLAGRAMLPPYSAPRLVAVLAAIALFGALDELHQLWIPNRFATVSDWVADLVGATIGLLVIHLRRASLTPETNHST